MTVLYPVVQMRDANGKVLFERIKEPINVRPKDSVVITWNVDFHEIKDG